MLARTYRDIGYFDRAIGELKGSFQPPAAAGQVAGPPPATTTQEGEVHA